MFNLIYFVFKPVFYFYCRYSCIYAIRLCIMCYDTSSSNNTSIGNMNSTHYDCTKSNPDIIADIGYFTKTFPRIVLVSDLACQSDRNSYLLVIMVISADNTNMIGNYYIVSNNTIGFNRGVFPNVKVVSYDYCIFPPNENSSSTMEIFSDMVSTPYGVF